MLRRCSVAALKRGEISRERGYVVIAMRHYPRFVKAALRDEFLPCLAPTAELLAELKALARELADHNAAFVALNYPARFRLSDEGCTELERLATIAREKDVFLVCQCHPEQHCHCDILIEIANREFRGTP